MQMPKPIAFPLAALAVFFVLGSPALADATPSAGAVPAPVLQRASHLVGGKLEDANGWEVGRVEDLLIDPQTRRVMIAVLTVGGRFQADSAPVGLKLPTEDLVYMNGAVRSRKTMDELGHIPALDSVLEDLDKDVRSRLLSAKALLGADLRDGAGRDVGGMEDLVVNLAEGTVSYAIADYDPAWLGSGKLVRINDLRMGKDAGDVTMLVDDAAMKSAAAYRSSRWPDLSDDTFSGRFTRWTNFN